MKKIAICCAILALFSAIRVHADILPGNIISNADIETGSPGSWTKGGNISSGQLTWATDYFFSSGHSLKIIDNQSAQYGQWYQYVNLSSSDWGSMLRLRWSWKSQNITVARK